MAWPKARPQNMLFPTFQQLESGTSSSSWAGGKTISSIQAAAPRAATGRAAAGLTCPAPPCSVLLFQGQHQHPQVQGTRGHHGSALGNGGSFSWHCWGCLHPQPRWLWQLTWELRSFDGIPQRDTGLLTSKTSQSCKANSRLSPGARAQAATSPCERGAPRGTPREESRRLGKA